MDALILAAGLGSRLKHYTHERPKAMVKYQGIEIVKYQIDTLRSEGISRIIIVAGYKSSQLLEFLKANFNNIEVITNDEYDSSNSAFSFMKAFNEIKSESYIHLNCDILFSKKLLSEIINDSNKNVIAVRDDLDFSDAMENVITVNRRIVNMSLRYSRETQFKAYGLAKIHRQALIENVKNYDKLSSKVQRIENYYGLIRMSLGIQDYYVAKSNKNNLAEINTVSDLKGCKFIYESNT